MHQNIRIRSRLKCKKGFHMNYNNDRPGFITGKSYHVVDIGDIDGSKFALIMMIGEVFSNTLPGHWFSLKQIDERNCKYVWDYFYTKSELRKLKIKKLNAIEKR